MAQTPEPNIEIVDTLNGKMPVSEAVKAIVVLTGLLVKNHHIIYLNINSRILVMGTWDTLIFTVFIITLFQTCLSSCKQTFVCVWEMGWCVDIMPLLKC